MMEELLRAVLHSFFLSRVSHKSGFLPKKVFNEAALHKQLIYLISFGAFCFVGFGHLEFAKFLT